MRIPIYIFFILFVLSGFSGLIYESIWSHYLKLFLGHAAYAQTLVLAMFMGGMAIGSVIAAKFSNRWKNLLLGYAVVEAVIGVFALMFHQIFLGATDLAFTSLIPSLGENTFMIMLTKWGIASLIILPQSILLGMTFPLMVAGVMRRYPDAGGKAIATLYFTNSFGGVFGVLVSSFILIYHFGLPGTILVAGLINIVLALVVWLLSAGDDYVPAMPLPSMEQNSNIKLVSFPALLLLISLFTGLSSFMYEMGWIRMLSLVLGSSTHSFELMLAAFILGLALGGWWLRNRIDHLKNPIQFLGYVQILMGLFAVMSLLVFHYSFDGMQVFFESIQRKESTYPLFLFFCALLCLLMMLPATFCAGMTLPLITKLAVNSEIGERGIGFVYASNTLGAIIGIFLSIHLIMPLFGLKVLITSGAVIDVILGIFLLSIFIKNSSYQSRVMAFVTTALMVVVIFVISVFDYDKERITSGVYRTGKISSGLDVLFYQDGKTSTVSVLKSDIQLTLLNNGKADAGIHVDLDDYSQDEATQVLLGIIPLLHKTDAETAAVIGMGSGLTTHAILASSQLKQVDTVEIEAAVVEASNLFRPKVERAYSDARSHIYIDDAKTFFTAHGKDYDIIISEPPNPWVSGVSSLFTQEFYQHIKIHMKKDAVFVQWLHLYELDIKLAATVFNALSKEFSDYQIYASNYDLDIVIVATKEGSVTPATSLNDLETSISDMLSMHNINNDADMQLHLVADKNTIGTAFQTYSSLINSDYFSYLENGAAKSRFAKSNSLELTGALNFPVPVLKLLKAEVNVDSAVYSKTDAYSVSLGVYNANILNKMLMAERIIDENIDGKAIQRYLFMSTIKEMLESCSKQQPLSKVGELYKLAGNVLPYLSRDNLRRIWHKVENSTCIKKLEENDKVRLWITLYKAISDSSPEKMLDISQRLLEVTPDSDRDLSNFLVVSALLGNYIGDLGRSDFILEKWNKKLDLASDQTNLLVAILIAR